MKPTPPLLLLTTVLSCCVLWTISFSALAQSAQPVHLQPTISQDGVVISSTLTPCTSTKNGTAKEYVLLAITNQNNYPVQLSFKKNRWFNGTCHSCSSSSPEHVVSISLEPEQTINGSCDTNNGLRIFSRMLHLKNVRQLTYYELIDITVYEIN